MWNARRVLPWLGPALVLLIEVPELWPVPHVGEWFFFWFAGHLVATGASPYDPANYLPAARDYGPVAHGIAVNTLDGLDLDQLRIDSRWLWPPSAGILLAPFGALPLEVGIPLMHLTTIVVALASAVILARTLVPHAQRTLAIAIVLASPPLVQVMRASSVTLVIFPSAAILFAAMRSRSGSRLGLSATGFTIRPQLFGVVGFAGVALLAARREWRMLAVGAIVWLAVDLVAFAISPIPPDTSLLDAARAFPQHDNASLWRFAYLIAPQLIAPVAMALLAVGAACIVIAVRSASDARDDVTLAGVLAFAVALAPYGHTYDQLALIPAWLVSLRCAANAPRGRAVAFAAIVIVALVYGWSAYLVGAAATRAPGGLAPILTLVVLALTARSASRPAADASYARLRAAARF